MYMSKMIRTYLVGSSCGEQLVGELSLVRGIHDLWVKRNEDGQDGMGKRRGLTWS